MVKVIMKYNFLKTINYISALLYLWIIVLVLFVLFKYGFDYSSKVSDPKNMKLSILYSFFPTILVLLVLLFIPISLITSIFYLRKKINFKIEYVIFIIIHCFFLIHTFYINKYGIIFWLCD